MKYEVLELPHLHIYPLIYPDIWLKPPVRNRAGCSHAGRPGTAHVHTAANHSPVFYAIAPPPSVGWFLTHLGRCSRETLRHWISAQHWLVFWAWESEFWNQSGGRERARRQNDGDFIPDGHRHVLATNGRDEEKDCGSPSLRLLF